MSQGLRPGQESKGGGRLKEVIAVLKKYNYDDGIIPEIVINILTDLGPTFVKIGQVFFFAPFLVRYPFGCAY